MRYINLTSHEKLLRYSNGLGISKQLTDSIPEDNEQESLFRDIHHLDEIAKKYKKSISALQDLSDEYQVVHKKVRLALRKLRIINVREINKHYRK